MKLKKILASILCVAMVLSTMSVSVFAKPESPVAPEDAYEIDIVADAGDAAEVDGVSYPTIQAATNAAEVDGVPYPTIQDAIDAAEENDIVTIAAGEYTGFNISNKNITIQGTVSDNGELLTTIKGGNPAIRGDYFNGTIKDLKILDAWEVMYAEPAGNVTVDNVYVKGATYGFHLVAYSPNLTWKIQNSYMDLRWANSFGVYRDGDAEIIIKNNKFDATDPYYPDYGALAVNTYLPNVTVADNNFGSGTKIYVDNKSVTDTSNIIIGANYYADGVENALADDEDNATIEIFASYTDENMTQISGAVAKIGDVCYKTLQDALASVGDGDNTITLLADVEDDVLVEQVEGVNITIDGNGHKFSGTIYINGNGRLNDEETLTIQNVNFWTNADEDESHNFIDASIKKYNNTMNYPHNVTVKDCSFTAEGKGTVAGLSIRQGNDIKVENCVFSNMELALWATGTPDIVVDGIVATGMNSGISVNLDSPGFEVKNSEITTVSETGYGVRVDGYGSCDATVVNCNIDSVVPVLVRNATSSEYSLTVGNSTLTAGNEDGYEIAVIKGDFNAENKDLASADAANINVNLDKEYKLSSYAVIANGKGYATLADALAAVNESDAQEITVNMLADGTIDITALQDLAIGGENAEVIKIDGNGHTLTFNKLSNDWNNIATSNDNAAKLILNDMTITDSGYNSGPWNRYDIYFACDVELNGVTSTKALAFKADATLNEVTINETDDNYAIWIQPNGQYVAIDGLNVNAENGRGIKIDEQYVDASEKVELTLEDATFTTAKKAAIVVKSEAGADITTGENIDISKVKEDTVNLVWVAEDAAANADKVTVNGEYAVVESAIATDISVSFEQVEDGLYNIVLKGNNGDINEFVGAEFTFANNSTTANGKEMKYEISGYTDATTGEVKTVVIKADEDNNTYGLHINGSDDSDESIAARLSGESIIIGQVKFNGQGTINFNVVSGKVIATEFNCNTEKYYVADGDAATKDTLVLTDATIGADTTKVRDVVVNIYYNHILDGAGWSDNQITVTLKDSFGKNVDPVTSSNDDRLVKFENVQEGRIVVTLEAPGFRKYVYTTMLNDEDSALVLNFWNNVKRGTDADKLAKIDNTNDAEQEMACNFLVGDIVMDYIVDEYDLAAVTSYYGMYNLTDTNKIGYDLNRDGNIDIIDVAYVLHTMGN